MTSSIQGGKVTRLQKLEGQQLLARIVLSTTPPVSDQVTWSPDHQCQ